MLFKLIEEYYARLNEQNEVLLYQQYQIEQMRQHWYNVYVQQMQQQQQQQQQHHPHHHTHQPHSHVHSNPQYPQQYGPYQQQQHGKKIVHIMFVFYKQGYIFSFKTSLLQSTSTRRRLL